MRISTNQLYERALDTMLTQQAKTSNLQEQLASGVRVQTPSDDPIASAQIELLSQRIGSTELMQKNRQAAENALTLEESTLAATVVLTQSIQVLQVQAGDAALSFEDRKGLAAQAKNLLSQLQAYANTKDGSGNFMFSGGQSSQPFSVNSSGAYVYNGDSTQRFQGITGSLQMAISDTGDNIFMRIPNGNGRFSISTTGTPNTGTGSLRTGNVVNEAAYVPDNYTMTFATNTQGKLVVMVTGANSGNVLPVSGLVDDAPLYEEGKAINFNGMEIIPDGAPNAGDSFSIKPAKNESIFSTVQRMIDNLNKPFDTAADKAATLTENNQLLAQLDSAYNTILGFQSDVGARLDQLETANTANTNLIDTSKVALKMLREIDPIAVATEYNKQLINLQAAQQSFVRIQGLSLFNYL